MKKKNTKKVLTVGERIARTMVKTIAISGRVVIKLPHCGDYYDSRQQYNWREEASIIADRRVRLARYIDKQIAKGVRP